MPDTKVCACGCGTTIVRAQLAKRDQESDRWLRRQYLNQAHRLRGQKKMRRSLGLAGRNVQL